MKQVIDGKQYDTESAILIADDQYWDGHNWERRGKNKYLYKTKKGNYFLMITTLWAGERDYLKPLPNEETAKEYYENLPEHEVNWEVAFGRLPEEA